MGLFLEIAGRAVVWATLFLAGYKVGLDQGELNLANYKLQEANVQAEIRRQWEGKLADAESKLVDLRRAESVSRSDNDKLRAQVAKLQRDAKTSESQWRARCADLAVRQKDLIDRAGTAIEFCAAVMK